MRSFTIDGVYKKCSKLRFKGGRYISDTPLSAVKKCFSNIQQHYGKKASKIYDIHIKETTQGSEHKVYKYRVRRIDSPTEVEKDGKIITFKYKTKVKSL